MIICNDDHVLYGNWLKTCFDNLHGSLRFKKIRIVLRDVMVFIVESEYVELIARHLVKVRQSAIECKIKIYKTCYSYWRY